jgi:hypothetical protein
MAGTIRKQLKIDMLGYSLASGNKLQHAAEK